MRDRGSRGQDLNGHYSQRSVVCGAEGAVEEDTRGHQIEHRRQLGFTEIIKEHSKLITAPIVTF